MNAANVVVGPASLTYQRAGGEAVDVGFTQGGILLRVPREYLDVEADQVVGIIKKSKTKEQMFVKTKLLESSFEHMSIAWDQASPSSPTAGTLGSASAAVQELRLVIVGPGPSGKTRTFTLSRCISIAEAEYSYARDAEAGQEVEFEAIKEDGTGGTTLGRFGTATDSGAIMITNSATLTEQESGVAMDPVIQLVAIGQVGADTWSIFSGALPTGVTMDADGEISGTPTQEGVFVFMVKVVDEAEVVAYKTFSMTVVPPSA